MKVKYFIVAALALSLCSWGAQADLTACYPAAAADNTGSTDSTVVTESSLIKGHNTEDGWARFDVSAIPDTHTIWQVEFHFYVNDTYYPYWSVTPVTTDPLGADQAVLHDDIIAEQYDGYYNYQSESGDYAPGWHTLVLGGDALADMTTALAQDWFALGVASRDDAESYYIIMDGWNEVNTPYLQVLHADGPVCWHDTCETAYPLSVGELFLSDSSPCTDVVSSWSCLPEVSLPGPDEVHTLEVPPGIESTVTVNCVPTDGIWDPAISIGWTCADGTVECVAAADNAGAGAAETLVYDVASDESTGHLYIFVDSAYGEGTGFEGGPYELSATIDYGIPNDTCDTAIDVSEGGLFQGFNCFAVDDYTSYICTGYNSAGPDVVYTFTLDDPSAVTLTVNPTSGIWDPSIYLVTDCADPDGTCVGGSDEYGSVPETISFDALAAGTYYLIVDSYYFEGDYSCGTFDLDVSIIPDTFDVSISCLTPTLTLPGMAGFRIDVTNVSATAITVSGGVDVALCLGHEVGTIRSGTMDILAGQTKSIEWMQPIGNFGFKTCNCGLVFTVNVQDDLGGHVETDQCVVATTCP
jgi:hypothetical protein